MGDWGTQEDAPRVGEVASVGRSWVRRSALGSLAVAVVVGVVLWTAGPPASDVESQPRRGEGQAADSQVSLDLVAYVAAVRDLTEDADRIGAELRALATRADDSTLSDDDYISRSRALAGNLLDLVAEMEGLSPPPEAEAFQAVYVGLAGYYRDLALLLFEKNDASEAGDRERLDEITERTFALLDDMLAFVEDEVAPEYAWLMNMLDSTPLPA